MEESELKIIWTAKAISDLKNIFSFLSSKSEFAASKTIDKIYSSVSVFKKGFLNSGQKEILLSHLSKEYRYLISGNYKIIYSFFSRQFLFIPFLIQDKIQKNLKQENKNPKTKYIYGIP